MRMMAIAAVAASLSLSGAYAQQPVDEPVCGPLDELTTILTHSYGEQPVMAGVSYDDTVMQLFANEETGTWTVLLTSIVTGMTCVADGGEMFMRAKVKPDA